MGWKLGWAGALLGAFACTADDGGNNDSAADSTDSAPSDSSSSDDDGTSSGGSLSGDATSGDASADGNDDEAEGAEFGETGTPSGPCFEGEVQLTNVVLDVNVNRILGEDVAVAFDEDSWACAYTDGEVGLLMVHYGPHEFGEPQNSLSVRLFDGVRSYDLATDPGPPGDGEDGLVYFGHTYQYESASTYQFDTGNQAGTGTLDVAAHPLDGGTTVDFTAVGTIAGDDGWEFDLHFTADVAQ